MSEEKLKIRFKCEMKVSFDQTVEMTKEEWEELKQTKKSEMECAQMSPIGSWIDMRDCSDYHDFDDIVIDVVDENNKNIEPEDYYGK